MIKIKRIIIMSLAFLVCNNLFSNPLIDDANYNNGNGTILEREVKDGVIKERRKCEVNVEIGDLLWGKQRIIYDNYTNKKQIGLLEDNDKVQILEIYTILLPKREESEKDSGEVWYKIKRGQTKGWIQKNARDNDFCSNPYFDNNWEILEIIKDNGKKWTVRKINQEVAVYVRLNVRDKPGLNGKKIFMLHDYDFKEGQNMNPQENHNIVAMTEETETIDGFDEHWLKVEYEKGKFGWIFGGYAGIERGGPKYYIPEQKIDFDFGWYFR